MDLEHLAKELRHRLDEAGCLAQGPHPDMLQVLLAADEAVQAVGAYRAGASQRPPLWKDTATHDRFA